MRESDVKRFLPRQLPLREKVSDLIPLGGSDDKAATHLRVQREGLERLKRQRERRV